MSTTPSSRALVLGGGGSTGNAWLLGVIAGLFDAGLDVTTADLTIGTSAGSTAAAQLAGETPAAGGFGLIAMRQRVSRLAGQLEIESEPGAGTAVSASLPAIPLGPSPQATRAEESE